MSKKAIKAWRRLDNAAKIFPPTTSRRDTKVFRFVCQLFEEVDPDALQRGLNETLPHFPLFRSVLKKGLFWYYFEESDRKPLVMPETEPPCSPLYSADRPGLLFRVLYYKKRINFEVFHALADGTGALAFFRTLVYFYLLEKHGTGAAGAAPLFDEDTAPEEQTADAFDKYYQRGQKTTVAPRIRAFRIKGPRLPGSALGIVEGVMPVQNLLNEAKRRGATLSEFLVAMLILATGEEMTLRQRSKPVDITVPVDLRRFFPSHTLRNFFGVIHVAHDFGTQGSSFEDVLKSVRASFSRQLQAENLASIINRYMALEQNLMVKAIPLFLKIPILKLASWVVDRDDTAAFSNVGRVQMPDDVAAHIHFFDVFLSTLRPQVCLFSYGDVLAISLTSPLASTAVPRRFFRSLAALGISVEINSNLEEVQNAAL